MVAFDIDGCVADIHETWFDIIRECCGYELPEVENVFEYDIRKYVPEMTKKEIDSTLSCLYSVDVPMYSGAMPVLQNVLDQYGELVFITSRTLSSTNNTRRWFNKFFDEHANIKIDYVGGDTPEAIAEAKVESCRRMGIEYMVEDCNDNVQALLDAGVNVLLMDRPWNRRVNWNYYDGNSCVERCYAWQRVHSLLYYYDVLIEYKNKGEEYTAKNEENEDIFVENKYSLSFDVDLAGVFSNRTNYMVNEWEKISKEVSGWIRIKGEQYDIEVDGSPVKMNFADQMNHPVGWAHDGFKYLKEAYDALCVDEPDYRNVQKLLMKTMHACQICISKTKKIEGETK